MTIMLDKYVCVCAPNSNIIKNEMRVPVHICVRGSSFAYVSTILPLYITAVLMVRYITILPLDMAAVLMVWYITILPLDMAAVLMVCYI
jgi:hypothetical protein